MQLPPLNMTRRLHTQAGQLPSGRLRCFRRRFSVARAALLLMAALAVNLGIAGSASASDVMVSGEVANRGGRVGETQTFKATVTNSGTQSLSLVVCGYYTSSNWTAGDTDPRESTPPTDLGSGQSGACMRLSDVMPGSPRAATWSLTGLKVSRSTEFTIKLLDASSREVLSTASVGSVIAPANSSLSLSAVSISSSSRTIGGSQTFSSTVANRGTIPVSPKLCVSYATALWSLKQSQPAPSEPRPVSTTFTRACMLTGSIAPGGSVRVSWELAGQKVSTSTRVYVDAFVDSNTSGLRQTASTYIREANTPPSLTLAVTPPGPGAIDIGANYSVSATLSGGSGAQSSRRACISFSPDPWSLIEQPLGSRTASSTLTRWSYNCVGLGTSFSPGGSKTFKWNLKATAVPTGGQTAVYAGLYQGSRRISGKKLTVAIKGAPSPSVAWNQPRRKRIVTGAGTFPADAKVSLQGRKGRKTRQGTCSRSPSGRSSCRIKLQRGKWKLVLEATRPDGTSTKSSKTVRVR